MYFNECPVCGASLDPGEKCDCKEKGLHHGNGNSPNVSSVSKLDHTAIIQRKKKSVNPLRKLRVSRNIPAKDMVDTVRQLYPKFDKALQSKCEHGDEYGIELKTRAMDELYMRYAPELLEEERHRRDGRHKLKCKVMCRLADEDYNLLQKFIRDDGYDTMQDWLSDRIKDYLKKHKK